MQITFDTQNPNDLKLLNELLARFESSKNAQPEVANTGTTASVVVPPSAEGSGVSEPVAVDAAPATSEKKERKPRAKKEEAAPEVDPRQTDLDLEPVAEVAAEPAPAPAPDAKPATIDEVRAALQAFTAVHGVPAGIELLKGFEAGRISELKAEQYGQFIARCAA